MTKVERIAVVWMLHVILLCVTKPNSVQVFSEMTWPLFIAVTAVGVQYVYRAIFRGEK
jgi:hypothetical protein